MPLLRNIGLLATCGGAGGQDDIHPVACAALAWSGDRITWVGAERDLPRALAAEPAIDVGGRLVVPGLIDCHTHIGFAGWRADEFILRAGGATYLDIARQGGGILRTVAATRQASFDSLLARCLERLDEGRQLGVTAVECKSGYGLDEESEIKLLRVYAAARDRQPSRVIPTLLAAHVVPREYRDRRDAYVSLVADVLVPRVATERLAVFCDVFVESSAFTRDEARRLIGAATRHGLRGKLHADQLSDGGGAALAAELRATSADHLEHVSRAGIAALAQAGVVAVALPLATLYMGAAPLPARQLIDAGVPLAVATDFNPGTAPSGHLPLALTLACTLQRMTPAEALKGATAYAARAVGLEGDIGSLEPGKLADFVVLDADSIEDWLYHFRANACRAVFIAGRLVAGTVSAVSS